MNKVRRLKISVLGNKLQDISSDLDIIIDEENKNIIDKFIQNHKDFELTEIDVNGVLKSCEIVRKRFALSFSF